MDAARAFVARNPGQPISVVFFNAKPTVALPLTTDRSEGAGGAREGAEARRGDAHLRRARPPRSPRCGAPRSARARVVLLSDGDDVGSATTLDAALEQLEDQNIRVYTVGIESPDFTSDDLEKIAERDRRRRTPPRARPRRSRRSTTSSASSSGNEYLLRYRSQAQPDQDVDVDVAVVGAEPVSFSYTSPSTGTAAPFQPAFRDQLLQSAAPDPARRRAGHPARLLHDPGAPQPPAEQAARLPPRRLRHAPGRGARRGAAQGGRPAPRRASAPRSSASGTSAGWRASRRTSTSRRSSASRRT